MISNRYFIAVAEELNFSRAAERLHIAQPPLSQQIRSLEAELGVQLFERSKHHIQLTKVGQAFLEEARRTLIQAEQAIQTAQQANQGEVGRLVVGFNSSIVCSVFPKILRTFGEQYPKVEIILREMSTSYQVKAVRDRSIDLGFVHLPIAEDTLNLLTVLEEPWIVAVPETHRLATSTQISLETLASERFILFPRCLAPCFYDPILIACLNSNE